MAKRQLRPFTVEIRSNRQNSRSGVPVLASVPPRGFLGAEQWADKGRENRTVVHSVGLWRAMPEPFEQPIPERIEPSEEHNGTRVSRVLPSLNSWMPTPDDTSERRYGPEARSSAETPDEP